MASTFEIATRAAIEELVQKHAKLSKFGLILTHEGQRELVDDLFILLQTSRTLKTAGDRFLRNSPFASAIKGASKRENR